MKKFFSVLVLAALLLSAAPQMAKAAQQISIGTNPVGMALYTMGASIAEVLRTTAPNMLVTVEATNGGVQNMLLLDKKEIEVGFTAPQEALEAREGVGRYKNKVPVYGLCSTAIAYQQSPALASSGIKDIRDLRGKRVGIGPPGSLTRFDNSVVLSGYGMAFDDMKGFPETLSEMVEKMKNGQLEATLWFGISPLGPFMDLEQARDLVWLSSDKEAMKPVIEKYPFYFFTELPARTYAKQDKPIPVLAQRFILVAHENLSEDVAYEIVKGIFSNLEQLRGIYRGWQTCGPETALQSMTLPLHPGAIKYFREIKLPGLDEHIKKTSGK